MNAQPFLRWPLPALAAWILSTLVFQWLQWVGCTAGLALAISLLLNSGIAAFQSTKWRKIIVATGFPLLVFTQLSVTINPWLWIIPLLVLLVLYPVNAWHDAPIFPTPKSALETLSEHAHLPDDSNILDAGCGLGDGLIALKQVFPTQKLVGIEWSWFLRLLCLARCPWATVKQGDIWAVPWTDYDLVYLFQRPESMERAYKKASAEMHPGSYLVSLEFEIPDVKPSAAITVANKKPVWIYHLTTGR